MAKINATEYLKEAMTGDVIMFSSVHPEGIVTFSFNTKELVRTLVRSPWSHVGVIVVDKVMGVMMWESNIADDYEQDNPIIDKVWNFYATLKDQITGIKGKSGPQLVYFADKLNVFGGEICVKKLISPFPYDDRDMENERRTALLQPLMMNTKNYVFEDGPVFWIPAYLHFRDMVPGSDLLVKDCNKR
jgi:hypothetical protein